VRFSDLLRIVCLCVLSLSLVFVFYLQLGLKKAIQFSQSVCTFALATELLFLVLSVCMLVLLMFS